jgi:hypothetical protein
VESNRELRLTPEARAWLKTLTPEDANRVTAAMDSLRDGGPTLGRPLVDHVKGSRHHKMKELRTGTIRMLFVFDRGGALMLLGGDKRGAWDRWYRRMVPAADRLYDTYRVDHGKGGSQWRQEPLGRGR